MLRMLLCCSIVFAIAAPAAACDMHGMYGARYSMLFMQHDYATAGYGAEGVGTAGKPGQETPDAAAETAPDSLPATSDATDDAAAARDPALETQAR